MTTAVSKKVMEGSLLTDLFYVKKREEKDHPPLENDFDDESWRKKFKFWAFKKA